MPANLFSLLKLLTILFAVVTTNTNAQSLIRYPAESKNKEIDHLLGQSNTFFQEQNIPGKALERRKVYLTQQKELKFNQNVNIFLGMLVALLFGIAIYVYFTQQKAVKLNKLVLEQKTELENMGRVKDQVFSVVSHDMRAPINSLISFIQLLEDGDITPAQLRRYAANLKNALGYTSSMMENLLNWASSQMQGFRPMIEKFESMECIRKVVNDVAVIATEKSITIEVKADADLWCWTDFNMTLVVLRNLVNNAIKFTPAYGKVVIEANLNPNGIVFSVADNGVGLTLEQIDSINTINNQEMGRTTLGTNHERGTGIGLVLCKTFTKIMNGQLSVESETGKGSTFRLSLPSGANNLGFKVS